MRRYFQFSMRDVLWVFVVAAVALMGWVEHVRLVGKIADEKADREKERARVWNQILIPPPPVAPARAPAPAPAKGEPKINDLS